MGIEAHCRDVVLGKFHQGQRNLLPRPAFTLGDGDEQLEIVTHGTLTFEIAVAMIGAIVLCKCFGHRSSSLKKQLPEYSGGSITLNAFAGQYVIDRQMVSAVARSVTETIDVRKGDSLPLAGSAYGENGESGSLAICRSARYKGSPAACFLISESI
ncbi:hypothetical protein I6F07_10910 [Ensifer sp. IC4062]|nr:hypothetical protein [Ensifer sp. IC4062]MCA1440721.1 hypothetical protein [Ensifer sp. IC4062]